MTKRVRLSPLALRRGGAETPLVLRSQRLSQPRLHKRSASTA